MVLETGGQSVIHFLPEGVVCEINLPAASIQKFAEEEAVEMNLSTPAPKPAGAGQIRKVFVVEDSTLIAMMIEDMCEAAGWQIVGPATRLSDALELADSETFDIALLDVNLAGEMSWDVARKLNNSGIPFAFSTGYDGDSALPDDLKKSPVISKPFTLADVETKLRQLMSDWMDAQPLEQAGE